MPIKILSMYFDVTRKKVSCALMRAITIVFPRLIVPHMPFAAYLVHPVAVIGASLVHFVPFTNFYLLFVVHLDNSFTNTSHLLVKLD